MGVDAVGVAGAEFAADARAEPVDGPAALLGRGVGGVLGEVVLAQLLAGAVGEGGDPARGHAEHGGDLGRGVLFDLGVPQDHAPAFGEFAEGEGGVAAFGAFDGAVDGGVGVDLAGVEGGEVVGELDALVASEAVVEGVAEGAEHVGAEGEVGAAAFAEGVEEFREGLGDEVVGAGGVVGQDAGEAAGGVDVAFVQDRVGGGVAAAGGGEQFGVGQGVGLGGVDAAGIAGGRVVGHGSPGLLPHGAELVGFGGSGRARVRRCRTGP